MTFFIHYLFLFLNVNLGPLPKNSGPNPMSFQFLTGRLTQVLHLPPNLKTLATPMPECLSDLTWIPWIRHCNVGIYLCAMHCALCDLRCYQLASVSENSFKVSESVGDLNETAPPTVGKSQK